MIGWHISVYRQKDGGASPATATTPEGPRLAVWQTGAGGLKWLNDLANAGLAVTLGGNGYPCRYMAPAQHLLTRFADNPPGANKHWIYGVNDILLDGWEGKTVIDHAAVAECRPDEWLLVEAWDES